MCAEPSCDSWHLPCASSASLNLDAGVVTSVISDTLRLLGSPVKSQRAVARKKSVALSDPRGHLCRPVIRQASRNYGHMGQWSKATSDQEWVKDSIQDGKFRACCRPWILIKLEHKFVFHIVTAGLVEYLSDQQDYEVSTPTLNPRVTKAILQSSKTNKQKKGNNHATSSQLRYLPEWWEESQRIEDTEVLAPAYTSQNQSQNFLSKWYRGRTILFLTLQHRISKYFDGSFDEAH